MFFFERSIKYTFINLYWTLFGMMQPDMIDINPQLKSTFYPNEGPCVCVCVRSAGRKLTELRLCFFVQTTCSRMLVT